MKYTAVLLAFAAGALAQSSSAPATTAVPELSPAIKCVQACDPADVTCQAACLGNARPNESQVIETTKCAEKCDQGGGSPEDTQKYSDCVQSCIANNFPSSQTGSLIPGGAPAAASSVAASGSNAAASATATGASATGSQASQTGSGSGSAAPQSTGAANSISARFGGAGLAGLLAIFAL
ncbi:hypothetical protein OPT61_g5412 [Boeremia exigua]|uniref:Uncharacterized protein n=1 Tax=Boeremia exigua TaxID=749465 RepID=A0ACC2IAD3_9PLEO|nr:hypothetical protein OPT61_g5412 [Boeremia exigua]